MLKKSLKKEQGELKVLKHVNKIVLSSILLCNLVFVPAVLAQNEQDLPINNQINAQMNLVENGISVKDLDIDPINTEKVKKSVSNSAKNLKKNTNTKEASKKTQKAVANSKKNVNKSLDNAKKNVKKSTKNAKKNVKKSVANSKKNVKKSTNKAMKNLKKNIGRLFGKK